MDYLDYRNAFLAHHGIKGQKWGVRNGPPYPLDEDDHSAREKRYGRYENQNRNLQKSGPIRSLRESGWKVYDDDDADMVFATKIARVPGNKSKINMQIDSKKSVASDKGLNAIKNFEERDLSKIINLAKRKLKDDYGHDVEISGVTIGYDNSNNQVLSTLITDRIESGVSIPGSYGNGYYRGSAFVVSFDGDKIRGVYVV